MSECVQLEGLGYYLKVKIQTSSFYIVMKMRIIDDHYNIYYVVKAGIWTRIESTDNLWFADLFDLPFS